MPRINKENKMLIGGTEYTIKKNDKGEELLSRNEIINNKNTEIILKFDDNGNSKDTEKYITDILSELYIEKMIKKYS